MLPQICYAIATPRQRKAININDLHGWWKLSPSPPVIPKIPYDGDFFIPLPTRLPAWPAICLERGGGLIRRLTAPAADWPHRRWWCCPSIDQSLQGVPIPFEVLDGSFFYRRCRPAHSRHGRTTPARLRRNGTFGYPPGDLAPDAMAGGASLAVRPPPA